MFGLLPLLLGIFDGISLWNVIHPLRSSSSGSFILLKILISNTGVLLANVGANYKVITPSMEFYNDSKGSLSPILLHLAWILPLYIICYTRSIAMYQELADALYRDSRKLLKDSQIKKHVEKSSLTSTFMWLFFFIHMHLLISIFPMATSRIHALHSLFPPIAMLQPILGVVDVAATALGNILACMLYSWYSFDPHWIADGLSLDARVSVLEKGWLYFVGFGLPYILMAKYLPVIVFTGTFLYAFPLLIILGTINDPDKPYRHKPKLSAAGYLQSLLSRRLPFFAIAKMQTFNTLKLITKVGEWLSKGSKGKKKRQ